MSTDFKKSIKQFEKKKWKLKWKLKLKFFTYNVLNWQHQHLQFFYNHLILQFLIEAYFWNIQRDKDQLLYKQKINRETPKIYNLWIGNIICWIRKKKWQSKKENYLKGLESIGHLILVKMTNWEFEFYIALMIPKSFFYLFIIIFFKKISQFLELKKVTWRFILSIFLK